jgi:Protein of unknown function (DUF3037)
MVETNSNTFAYHVIRYVPNLIRDEWVNIGVVIRDSVTEKFRVRAIEEEPEYARVRRLHPAVDETALRRYGSFLEDSLSKHDGTLDEWIAKLDRSLSNAVQFGPQVALLADDLDVEVDRLYGNHVAIPRGRSSLAGVAETRSGIRAGANQVFRIAGLWPKLERSVRVDKFTYSGDPLRLDYSYRRNGTQGFIHSLALTRDPAQAKVLAYTADAIRSKFEKTEFIAITEVEPHPEQNDRHKFVTGLFEKEKIQIVPLSRLPAWAHQMRPVVH